MGILTIGKAFGVMSTVLGMAGMMSRRKMTKQTGSGASTKLAGLNRAKLMRAAKVTALGGLRLKGALLVVAALTVVDFIAARRPRSR